MTQELFTYENHINTFNFLCNFLKKSLTENEKKFLLDFVRLQHDFSILNIPNIEKLPAIQWKIKNLEKLKQTNIKKFEEQYNKLQEVFTERK